MESRKEETEYTGIGASPGIAHGPVSILREKEIAVPKYQVEPALHKAEVARFENALLATRKQIQKIRDQVEESLGEEEARIFDAHLMVLEDQALIDEIVREMDASEENVEASLWRVGNRYIEAFGQIDDEYLRERASDIRDVMRRLISNLTGQSLEDHGDRPENKHVVVAQEIAPSDSASIDKNQVLALVTDLGGKTGHTVIVARSMNIPAVVGLGDISRNVVPGDVLLVDGYAGKVVVNPSENTLFCYGKLKDERASIEERLIAFSKNVSETKDGHPIQLQANIEAANEAKRALEIGADGVGLFRTEYLFMNTRSLPSEEEQFDAYSGVAEVMDGRSVVIRTLDLGGDKMSASPELGMQHEANPFLGYRAIRYCLDNIDVFTTQLRAILRASAHGNVKIMYPMISGLEEMKQANECLEIAKEQLRSEGIAFNESIETGSMIEIPSAAIACDTLVSECSFFSIGSNDLIQYLMAVDRLNDRVAHLYEPTHPAVIRMLDMIVKSANKGGVELSICGEMAGDPILVPLLIGLGIESLSMSPGLLPHAKFVAQSMDLSEARELAEMALLETDAMKILENLTAFYDSRMASIS
ncbi:MAG: phosphoenolpyruvate--protein phosphotransferase [Verrucomicrobiota bacterium]|nr:phosphoenolpyruvate--protein phosphotransferase [Verrucomicrobiota bacterium]